MTKLYTPLNWNDINELAVRGAGLGAVYISNNSNFTEEEYAVINSVLDAITTFHTKLPSDVDLFDLRLSVFEGGLVFFQTEALAEEFYSFFTTELTDSSFLYAVLYSAEGHCINENT